MQSKVSRTSTATSATEAAAVLRWRPTRAGTETAIGIIAVLSMIAGAIWLSVTVQVTDSPLVNLAAIALACLMWAIVVVAAVLAIAALLSLADYALAADVLRRGDQDRLGHLSSNVMATRPAAPITHEPPIGSPLVSRFFYRYFLPLLFVTVALSKAVAALWGGSLGIDAEIYIGAAHAWVAGLDPWEAFAVNEATGRIYHFSALPPMVVMAWPFTLLPEGVAIAFVVVLAAVAAVYVVRRLELPWYWLAFPPLVEGVLSGNPSLPVLALLLSGFAFVAPLLKIYAFVPMLGEARWRQIGVAAFVVSATVVLFPSLWGTYLADFGAGSARLIQEANGGHAANTPVMAAGVLIALLLIVRVDRRAAGWLAVPALWPASQFHWSTLAMPVMTPALAVLLAIPTKGMPAIAVMVYAIVLRRDLLDRLPVVRSRRLAARDDE